ncbi:hypothetical protein [Caballeronia arvi]|uniref:hypothetical protein n=1 Tax=Caballeronia arvi TaxID=1777135 RepID=UPI00117F962B|nr:hypothetical protein [Caballeronia arvi]
MNGLPQWLRQYRIQPVCLFIFGTVILVWRSGALALSGPIPGGPFVIDERVASQIVGQCAVLNKTGRLDVVNRSEGHAGHPAFAEKSWQYRIEISTHSITEIFRRMFLLTLASRLT